MTPRLAQWSYQHGFSPDRPPLIVTRLRGLGLDDDMVVEVLNVVDGVCSHCRDNDHDCQCWNDE